MRLFSFKSPVDRAGGRFNADPVNDDDTVGNGTANSEGTMTINSENTPAKSILRRNSKKNTARSVSWSHTFDTYEERDAGHGLAGGVGGFDQADTFETIDSIDILGGREGNHDVVGELERTLNYLYPRGMDSTETFTETFDHDYNLTGDTTTPSQTFSLDDTIVSEDGVVEIKHVQHREVMPTILSATPGPMSMPVPSPPLTTPRQTERKQLPAPATMTSKLPLLPPDGSIIDPRQEERELLDPMTTSKPPLSPPLAESTTMTAMASVQAETKHFDSFTSSQPSPSMEGRRNVPSLPPKSPAVQQMEKGERFLDKPIMACSSNTPENALDMTREKYSEIVRDRYSGVESKYQDGDDKNDVSDKNAMKAPVAHISQKFLGSNILVTSNIKDTHIDNRENPGGVNGKVQESKISLPPPQETTKNNLAGQAGQTKEAAEVAFEEEMVARLEPSAVFIPRELELPKQVLVTFSDSGSLGSLSMEDLDADSSEYLTLDGTVEGTTMDEKKMVHDRFVSVEVDSSLDPDHIRAASEDGSISNISEKKHNYENIFKQQQRVDRTSAGHMGLILPFLDSAMAKIEDTLFVESWDMKAMKSDLLRGMPAVSMPFVNMPSVSVLSPTSQAGQAESSAISSNDSDMITDDSDNNDGNNGHKDIDQGEVTVLNPRDGGNAKTKSPPVDGSGEENEANGGDVLIDDQEGDDVRVAMEATDKVPASDCGEAMRSEMPEMNTPYDGAAKMSEGSMEDAGINADHGRKEKVEGEDAISTKSLINKLASSSAGNAAGDFVAGGDVAGDFVVSGDAAGDNSASDAAQADVAGDGEMSHTSAEVHSAQLESEDDDIKELSMQDEILVRKAIQIRDLGKSKMMKKKLKNDKKNKRKDKVKTKNRDLGPSGEPARCSLLHQLPHEIIMDSSFAANENVSLGGKSWTGAGPGSGPGQEQKERKRSVWGGWKKRLNKGLSTRHSNQDDLSFLPTRHIFNPTLLPPGRIYTNNDNNGNNTKDDNRSVRSLISQASSCVTTESILSELKLIEDTAKLVYQRCTPVLTNGPGSGTSHGDIMTLFSPEEGTEVVFWEPVPMPMDDQWLHQPVSREGQQWKQNCGAAAALEGEKGGKKLNKKFLFRFKPRRKYIPGCEVTANLTPK